MKQQVTTERLSNGKLFKRVTTITEDTLARFHKCVSALSKGDKWPNSNYFAYDSEVVKGAVKAYVYATHRRHTVYIELTQYSKKSHGIDTLTITRKAN